MLKENVNVQAFIPPDIKASAEAILEELNIPVSMLIDMTYRQVIRQHGIPFEIKEHHDIPTLDSLSEEELAAMLQSGLDEAKQGKGLPLDEAFRLIRAELGE